MLALELPDESHHAPNYRKADPPAKKVEVFSKVCGVSDAHVSTPANLRGDGAGETVAVEEHT